MCWVLLFTSKMPIKRLNYVISQNSNRFTIPLHYMFIVLSLELMYVKNGVDGGDDNQRMNMFITNVVGLMVAPFKYFYSLLHKSAGMLLFHD